MVDRDVVEAVDIEGCGLVSCDYGFRMLQCPLQPLVEEMSLDPSIAVLWIFEELQVIYLKSYLAALTVCITAYGVEICHVLFHVLGSLGKFRNFV